MPPFVQYVLFCIPVFLACGGAALLLNKRATEYKIDQLIREKREEEKAAKAMAKKAKNMANLVDDDEFVDQALAAKPAAKQRRTPRTQQVSQNSQSNPATYVPAAALGDADAEMEAFIEANLSGAPAAVYH